MFCDSDIVFTTDIKELFEQADDKYAVMCVKHDYTPKSESKWMVKTNCVSQEKLSSVVLYNCGHNQTKN